MGLTCTLFDKTAEIAISGNMTRADFLRESAPVLDNLKNQKISKIIIRCSLLKKWDSGLLAVLFDVQRWAQKNNIKVDFKDVPAGMTRLLSMATKSETNSRMPQETMPPTFLECLGDWGIRTYAKSIHGLLFLNEVLKSLGRLVRGKAAWRKVDFLFALEDAGPRAVGIVSLISFMVGLILAFVGSIQLRLFDAEIYVASLVAIGVTRIIGAMMSGIIMAGRTGASYAATIGTMQVNEELDALKTMGISRIDFLVLPRLVALTLMMPLLTLLADVMGILGGAFVGLWMLDIPHEEYYKFTLNALKMKNFLVGAFHGTVYGVIIALCGSYYGLNCGRDADSVGRATTRAVVSSIIWMVVITGILTFIFKALNI